MSDASDTLRRAAKVLREHAAAAEKVTPGRWTVEDDDDAWELYAGRGKFHGFKIAKCMKRHQRYMEYWPPEPHSAYIAMVDPAVGLALADWLEHESEKSAEADRYVRAGLGMRNETERERRAMSAARTLLREDERHDLPDLRE